MRSPVPPIDTAVVRAQIGRAHGLERLRGLIGEAASALDADMIAAILEEASRFSAGRLGPFNAAADEAGCRIQDGRVLTAPGHRQAWAEFLEAGWLGLDQPPGHGGQGLPQLLLAACQEIFDRGSVAFGMLATAQRGAARLIEAHADEATRAEWLDRLISGEWAATICISEPDAGSDVGRIRTLARPDGEGGWRITGEKIWISYGDHDLAPRIGHCLLARTPDAPPGAAGLSLFLVPDGFPDTGERNGVVARRLEEKLGLHGSPTCAMGFEDARGVLIGTPGRGLAQLFTMIATMRLMVSVQGLAVAGAATDVALAYAEERRQGGRPDAPAVPIVEHADVRRMLAAMASRAEVLRGLIYTAAVHADLGRLEQTPEARERSQALAAWLLPICKTFAGESAFELSSEAIQVLGGAGYVKDWPVEQLLRDCRVFTIFEGTSGVQSLDLLHRRLRRDEGRGLQAFLAAAESDLERLGPAVPEAPALREALDVLRACAGRLQAGAGDAAAYPFLRLAAVAAMGWSALRLAASPPADPAGARLAAAGRHWLADLAARAAFERAQIELAEARAGMFESLRRPA
jgi:alkylation response protein AidB-like acyl-CoA dehydrogenase